jgi:hypothetical protein
VALSPHSGADRRFVEALAREHTVIRYDTIGCGLSHRARTDFTMESELATVKALVAHLELKRWVVVRPPGARTGLRLAQADGPHQTSAVGTSTPDGSGSSCGSTTSPPSTTAGEPPAFRRQTAGRVIDIRISHGR